MDRLDASAPPTHPSAPTTQREQDVVNWVDQCYSGAQQARVIPELEWALYQAIFEGEQWYTIFSGRMVDLRSLGSVGEAARYQTENHVDNLVRVNVARATESQPDASVVPLTVSEIDREAAREGAQIVAYCDATFDRQTQAQSIAVQALVSGAGYLKIYWDANKEAYCFPSEDSDEAEMLPIGDICEEIVLPWDLYIDTSAACWDDALWLIHATIRPMSWVRERWGDKANGVQEDATIPFGVPWQMRVSSGVSSERLRNGVTVKEYWERPSARFPQGRYIVVAGGRLMEQGDNPYHAKIDGCLPFVRLPWKEVAGSPYATGMVKLLTPLQQRFNRINTRILEVLEKQRAYVFEPKRSEVSVTAFDDDGVLQRIPYSGNQPPIFATGPSVTPEMLAERDGLLVRMMDIAGARPVSQGKVPAGVTSGVAIELLQQADATQGALFYRALEKWHKQRAEWEIFLFAQFGSDPYAPARALGIDEDGNPGDGDEEPMSEEDQEDEDEETYTPSSGAGLGRGRIEALAKGGVCRVRVVPGSAIRKHPATQNEQVMSLYQAGILGPVGSPEAAAGVVELLNMSGTDRIAEHWKEAQRRARKMLKEQQEEAEEEARERKAAMLGQGLAADPGAASYLAAAMGGEEPPAETATSPMEGF